MIKNLLTPFFIGLILTTNASAAEKMLTILPSESSLSWTGKKVTGQHSGTVNIKSGTVKTKNGTLTGVECELDMNSIKVTDIKDEKNNKKLLSHLFSDDFFATTPFPYATFTLTKATLLSPTGHDTSNYTVSGTLSIKGITHDITFPARIDIDDNEGSATATITLDRTQWNIRYGSGKFFEGLGDKLIFDNFEVRLDIKAKS